MMENLLSEKAIKLYIEKAFVDGMLDEKLYISDMVWNRTSKEFSRSYVTDYQDPETFSKATIKPEWLYSIWQDSEGSMNYILYFDSNYKPTIHKLYGFNGVLFKKAIKEGASFEEAINYVLL